MTEAETGAETGTETETVDLGARIAGATATTDLDDGRRLAYAEFGDPAGDPVFVLHGGIGSRGFGLLFEEAATRLGVRVVAPDRPGYGRSDPLPGRTLLDWPDDVVALADAMGIDRFAVLGVSGGGPYAAACAYAIPERLTGVAMVSSMGPPGAPLPRGIRVLSRVARVVPWVVRIPFWLLFRRARGDPEAFVRRRASGAAGPEAAMHRGEAGRILHASTVEAGRQGTRAPAREVAVVSRPWGFRLADVTVPVGVWHGALDRTIPVGTGEYVAAAIPDATLTTREDVGHLSIAVEYAEEILTATLDRPATDEW